jgi:TolA-binding protein
MKFLAFIVACSLAFSSFAISQSTPPQTPPPGSESSSGAGQTKSTAPPTTPDRANAQTTVPADIKEVRRNLEALKTAVNKMDEGPEHDVAEQNVKFLESLVSYLEHENTARSSSKSKTSGDRKNR